MVLSPEEIDITTKMLGMEDVVGPDTLIVALVRPEVPAGERRRTPPRAPQKALMNLVSDLCETRSATHRHYYSSGPLERFFRVVPYEPRTVTLEVGSVLVKTLDGYHEN